MRRWGRHNLQRGHTVPLEREGVRRRHGHLGWPRPDDAESDKLQQLGLPTVASMSLRRVKGGAPTSCIVQNAL